MFFVNEQEISKETYQQFDKNFETQSNIHLDINL